MKPLQFIPNQKLLNPHFEGYKLHTTNGESSKYSLLEPIKLPLLSNQTSISFEEMKSRVCFNHLFLGSYKEKNGKREEFTFYINHLYQLVAIRTCASDEVSVCMLL
jgi:hypothetical protein